jgi:hypothetical protein
MITKQSLFAINLYHAHHIFILIILFYLFIDENYMVYHFDQLILQVYGLLFY